MRRRTLSSLAVVIAITVRSLAAADCLELARGIKSAYLGDTGGAKGTALEAQNHNCGKGRWMDLSEKYRALNDAIDTGDAASIKKAAEDIDHLINRTTKKVASCWQTMLRHQQILGEAVDANIRALSKGAC